MEILKEYIDFLNRKLEETTIVKEPEQLYKPIDYILSIGGKRIRPALTLMTCDLLADEYEKALPAAMAVEMFHNFSLIHDDIMDNAPLRRGYPTVHEKWDVNTGILSGDAMLILAYRFFESYEPEKFRDLAKLFSKTAIEVCEGQQLDMDFENREDVSMEEYILMIEQKTAVLLGAAMKMGAIVADASATEQEKLYEFGKNLGIAFQLQDDYLDTFGDPKFFGKQKSGDIIANKKTILFLLAKKHGKPEQVEELLHLFSITPKDAGQKIKTVKEIYNQTGVIEATKKQIDKYRKIAFDNLENLSLSENKKTWLKNFVFELMERNT